MPPSLLERSGELSALWDKASQLAEGWGSLVLISGEAGIGKTSLIDTFLAALPAKLRVLHGGCDDLVAANPRGPLREAFRGVRSSLVHALAGPRLDLVLDGLAAEFGGSTRPAVMVIEDIHWADDATLDVLAYLVRRIETFNLLLVLTYRDDEVRRDHPAHRLLNGLAGPRIHRLPLPALSSDAVGALVEGTGWDAKTIMELTAGNPFFITEMLATPPRSGLPTTVSGAVLARLTQLTPRCRDAVERISVVPGLVELELAELLLGPSLEDLTQAELYGVLRVRPDGLEFRHELARRAIEAALPGLRRRALHRSVTDALLAENPADLPRLVHHAVQAHHWQLVASCAPRAGHEASAAGAQRQALTLFEAALRHEELLARSELGRVLDDYAWELYNAHRCTEAVRAAERAVTIFAELGDVVGQGGALTRLCRFYYMVGALAESRQAIDRAVHLLERAGSVGASVAALASQGALLALVGETAAATRVLRGSAERCRSAGRAELEPICQNYLSLARGDLDPDLRLALLRESVAGAHHLRAYEFVARGYTNLSEMLYRYGRYAELGDLLGEALEFANEHGFWSHIFNLEVHQCLLWVRRGDWGRARSGLEGVRVRYDDPGMLAIYSASPYGRLLARTGDPGAEPLLRDAWAHARRQHSLVGLGYAGAALTEWAWLNERLDVAAAVRDVWRDHADRPSAGPLWAEIQRYGLRAGLPAEQRGGPEHVAWQPWTAGIAGDWRQAATRWQEIGDPYERALELADSGEAGATRDALLILEDLDAVAAVRQVKLRLRALGVRSVPRGPLRSTRGNPSGLTSRELNVLALVTEGLTNAEIAERLVVSVRTIDHHVSAILAKLGVGSRRQAVRLVQTRSTRGNPDTALLP